MLDFLQFYQMIFSAKAINDLWEMLMIFQDSFDGNRRNPEELESFVHNVEQKLRKIDNFAVVQYMMKYLDKIKFEPAVCQIETPDYHSDIF